MIYWDGTSEEEQVPCALCGSHDTRVSIEFLNFTRYACRACSRTYMSRNKRQAARETTAAAEDVLNLPPTATPLRHG